MFIEQMIFKETRFMQINKLKALSSYWQKDYEELKGNLLQLHIQRSPSDRLKWLTTPANILEQLPVNPLTPMGNQNIISPHNINTKPSRQVMGIQENIN